MNNASQPPQHRGDLRFILAALLFVSFAAPIFGAHMPNIVLILADDLGWGDVTCYNPQSKIPTPHLDHLAAQGLRFTDAHSSSGVCVPSRFSLMTGLHAFRMKGKGHPEPEFRNYGGNQSTVALVPADGPTLPGILAKAGYATSMIGKWHLGFDDLLRKPTEPLRGGPTDRGFQHYFGIPSSLDIDPYVFIEGNRIVTQATEDMPAHASTGWPDDRMGEYWRAGKAAPEFRHADVLEQCTKRAETELRRLAGDAGRPFFVYYAMPSPHSPLLPSAPFRGRTKIGIYGDYVAQTDDAVGRVLRVLAEAGAAENTLVIATSDNGPFWYPANAEQTGHAASGPWRGMKGDAWEGGHRVPFIARWPGHIPAAATNDAPISLTDLLVTTAALLSLPAEATSPDGVDFSPALLGKAWTRPEQRPLVARSSGGAHMLRHGSWKFISQLGSGGFSKPQNEKPAANGPTVQLYDLAHDPGESKNLAGSEPQRAAEFRRQLTALLAGNPTARP